MEDPAGASFYRPQKILKTQYIKNIYTTYSHPYPQNMHNDFPIICTVNPEVQGPTPLNFSPFYPHTFLPIFMYIRNKNFREKNEAY